LALLRCLKFVTEKDVLPLPAENSRIRVRMTPREIDEPHRVSSQLELLFDLTFVIAVAAVTAQLAHRIAAAHALDGILPFLQVFFAIWWAWMNFTWFASSYDTDDVPYRLLTMVQMAGVLVLAAGVPAAADHDDWRAVTIGYVIMRIALVAQWVRAGVEDPASRRTAFRYAAGVALTQVGWIVRLVLLDTEVLPSWTQFPVFLVMVVLELSVPWWAERTVRTNWHPHHIAERYGLFTIILLGESVLAAATGVEGALDGHGISGSFLTIAISALVLLFALWWLYFLEPAGEGLSNRRERSYFWGYSHYGIFAALAALGAGLEVAVEQSGHHLEASHLAVTYAVAIPVAVYLTLLWAVHAPLVDKAVIPPPFLLACVVIALLLPLTVHWIGVAAVVAAIAATSVLLIAATITRTD
jgi:low temperature requirement protein LtrA